MKQVWIVEKGTSYKDQEIVGVYASSLAAWKKFSEASLQGNMGKPSARPQGGVRAGNGDHWVSLTPYYVDK